MMVPVVEVRFQKAIPRYTRVDERWTTDRKTIVALDPIMGLVHIKIKDHGSFSVPLSLVTCLELAQDPFTRLNEETEASGGAYRGEIERSGVSKASPGSVRGSTRKEAG